MRRHALELRAAGRTWRQISEITGVSVSALLDWKSRPDEHQRRRACCSRCGGATLDPVSYAALLGYYLGDGHITRAPRFYCLRISCDATQPGIVADVAGCIAATRPGGKIFYGNRSGAINVISNWQHWPCLFPQHGPGPKHQRPIVLDDWQRTIVDDHPGQFLRGLFHSDGCRTINSTTKPIAGKPKTYRYPRWQFVNASVDIRDLCCWALDLVDVAWRQSNPRVISVSRREAVARLDALIGPKN